MKKAAIYMGAAAWRSFLSTASSRTVRAFNGLAWSRWRALSAMLSWPGGRLMRGSASERESVSSTETRTETSGGIISRQRLTSGCPPRLVTRDYVDPTLACPSPGLAGDFFSPAVMRLAQMEGISVETLRKMEGTGEGGRPTIPPPISAISEKIAPPTHSLY